MIQLEFNDRKALLTQLYSLGSKQFGSCVKQFANCLLVTISHVVPNILER